MQIPLKELALSLKESLGAVYLGSDYIAEISTAHFWDGNLKENALYIVRASELCNILPHHTDQVFLCIEDMPIPPSCCVPQAKLLRIPNNTSLGVVFNAVNDVLGRQARALDHFAQILERVSHDIGYNSYATSIHEMLGCPAAVLDSSFSVLSSSFGEDSAAKKWWQTFLKSRQQKYGRIPTELFTSDQPICIPLERPARQYAWEIFVPVRADNSAGTFVGAIYLLCTYDTIPKSYAPLLCFTAKTLSWQLWSRAHTQQDRDMCLELLLTDMLNGNAPGTEEIKSSLENCRFKTNRSLVLIVAETSATAEPPRVRERMQESLASLWPDSYFFHFSGDLLILLPSQYFDDTCEESFCKLLSAHDCYAGMSTVFHSIDAYFVNHYVRTLSAAKMAREFKYENRCVYYHDIILNDFVSRGSSYHLKQLCDPMLLKMIRHDKHYGTEYFYTLSCYWQLDRDVNRVCNYMHLHKNTLYYRLLKIRNLLQQNIDDYDSFLQLVLSINILEVLGSIPRYRIFDDVRREKRRNPYSCN